MKKISSILLLAGVLTLLTAFTLPAGTNFSWKKVRVLVYTKNGKGFVHDNIATASAAIQALGAQHGFSVTVSDNPADFTDASLKRFNVLVFNNTNNDVFDNDTQKLALMHFTQAGGGFVGIHSASGTERNWPWFKRMIGGSFVRHAPNQVYTQTVIDPHHPSTSFLPKTWTQKTECYYVKEVNPDIHVLMVNDLTTVKDKEKEAYTGASFYGNSFPAVWCHEYDGGRQWYTSLGHESSTYNDPLFRQHLLGGIRWAAGNNTPLDYSKIHATSPNEPLPY